MEAMKIYKHTFNDFRNVVETVEIEVEEKPKTYVVIGRQKGVCESRIKKDDIGKLDRYWCRKMFMLSPDKKPYINSLIADKENEINRLKDNLEQALEKKDLFRINSDILYIPFTFFIFTCCIFNKISCCSFCENILYFISCEQFTIVFKI